MLEILRVHRHAASPVRPRRRLRRIALVPVWASALLLAGCSYLSVEPSTGPTPTSTPTMTSTPRSTSATPTSPPTGDTIGVDPIALKDRLVAAARVVPRALGTSPWKLTRGPVAEPCTDAAAGVQFSWIASGPGSRDVARDTRKIADAYRKLHIQVVVLHTSKTEERLLATREDLGNMELDLRRSAVRVDATSNCVLGDPGAYPTLSPEPPVPSPSS